MRDPILALYCLMAIAIGIGLAIFSLHGVCDPFWSRSTRIVSGAGVIVGFAVAVFGFVVLEVRAS